MTNIDPISEFELDVLAHTGDLDLATQIGDITRYALDRASEAFAELLGVPVDIAHELTVRWWAS